MKWSKVIGGSMMALGIWGVLTGGLSTNPTGVGQLLIFGAFAFFLWDDLA